MLGKAASHMGQQARNMIALTDVKSCFQLQTLQLYKFAIYHQMGIDSQFATTNGNRCHVHTINVA